MEIVDKNTFICFNANHSDGIELKRTEIDILK